MNISDFEITAQGPVSGSFRAMGIYTFVQACSYITVLPYGRNADKNNLLTVFTDNCGTCSTKHALLKQLTDENKQAGFRLMLGIYRMNGANTTLVASVLAKYRLDHLPEAHSYLRYEHQIIDCTAASPLMFQNDLLEESEIVPAQITEYKVNYHRSYLQNWIMANGIPYNLDEIWTIREACIAALSVKPTFY